MPQLHLKAKVRAVVIQVCGPPGRLLVTGIPSPILGHRGTVSEVCVFTVFSVILMYVTV